MNGRTSRLPRLVVGISRSPASWWALAWATGEARRRGAGLLLVHVYRPHFVPAQETCQGFGSVPVDLNADLIAVGEGLIWVAIEQAVGQLPYDLDVEQVVTPGRPAEELSCLALGDDMLVLGSRHRGWLRRHAPGSVARACARRAQCPVVVVPEPSRAALTPTLPVDGVRGRWTRWVPHHGVPHHADRGELGPWRRRQRAKVPRLISCPRARRARPAPGSARAARSRG